MADPSIIVGLIGEPGAGKTTVFEAMSAAPGGEHSAAGPGGTMIRTVQVVDPRLDLMAEVFQPKKVTPLAIRFVDFQGAGGKSEARLAALRDTDAFLLVVRAFRFGDAEPPDPVVQERAVQEEWLLYDMEGIDKRQRRLEKNLRVARSKEPSRDKWEQELLHRLRDALEAGTPLRDLKLDPTEETKIRGFGFLSRKPRRILWNLGEDQEPPPVVDGPEPLRVRGQVEREIAELPEEDRAAFLEEMRVDEPSWVSVPRDCLMTLGALTFFTGGEKECRAWPLRQGETALDAAGRIHEDLARGFIRAEVIAWEDFAAEKGPPRDKRRGRLEGREYVVQDGDMITIRFST